jgi:FeS assembly protein IscX
LVNRSRPVVYAMELTWEDDYAIALALNRDHAGLDPLRVDWITLHRWVIDLPEFVDDKSVFAQYLLENIQREWYEEVAAHESI